MIQLNTVLLMSGGWVQALQLLAALSLLILLHEFGHFFFARLFKTRVEKFYLFFDFLFPFSGILNFPLFKIKKGDTEYGLGWFPLGGYVKIAGMVDESMDKEALAQPPQPWEYRSKKAYQRLFIMLGGIIMNVLVAIVLYMIIFGVWGEQYLRTSNAKYGIMVDSTAQSIGLRNGDQIVGVGGQPVEKFGMIMSRLIFDNAKTIQVMRDGESKTIVIPPGTVGSIVNADKGKEITFIQPRTPVVVADVVKGSAAEKIGLKENDSVIAVNGQPVFFFDEFIDAKAKATGNTIALTVVRPNSGTIVLQGPLPAGKILGMKAVMEADRFFDVTSIKYNPIEAVGKGFRYTFEKIGSYVKQLQFIFTSKEIKISKSVGGIYSFGKLFSPVFDWFDFLQLTAFISVILAVMNLLPIPGLDGGYVIFLLFEMISGRKVSEKVMERATTVGLVLLLGLMLYANGLDIFRMFQK